ncbi:MAG: 30S ribosomal protein S9 [Patescibacteria group bacterium]
MPKTSRKNTSKKITSKKKADTAPKKRILRKAKAFGLKKEVKIEKKLEAKKPEFKKKISAPRPQFIRKFVSALGRRKEATARAKLSTGSGKIIINNKELKEYFPIFEHQQIVESPLAVVGQRDKCDLQIKIEGGGKGGQAEAARLAISRCLKIRNIMFRVPLKKAGFLTRDAREKERKKYGLKGARRAPQWAKR